MGYWHPQGKARVWLAGFMIVSVLSTSFCKLCNRICENQIVLISKTLVKNMTNYAELFIGKCRKVSQLCQKTHQINHYAESFAVNKIDKKASQCSEQ